jgi:hypothetical protein
VPTSLAQLLETVDGLFAARDPQLVVWPDPHPGRSPRQQEYSRVTNPAKWRLIGVRAAAWVGALTAHGLAHVLPAEPGTIDWTQAPGTILTAAVLVEPAAPGALPLIVARNRIQDVSDAGVTLGVGRPVTCVGWFPECGCDACDTGGADELANLDQYLTSILTGSTGGSPATTGSSSPPATPDGSPPERSNVTTSTRSSATHTDGANSQATPGCDDRGPAVTVGS